MFYYLLVNKNFAIDEHWKINTFKCQLKVNYKMLLKILVGFCPIFIPLLSSMELKKKKKVNPKI